MSQEQDFAALQQQLQLQLALNAELLRAKDESLARLSNQLTREKILSQEKAAEAAKAQVALKSLNAELAEARKMRRRGMEAALEKDQFVDSVLHYLGPGHWAFVALINRNWRGRYLQYCKILEATAATRAGEAHAARSSALRYCNPAVPKLIAFQTYYTACVQSPSRLRMSNELGMDKDTFSKLASSKPSIMRIMLKQPGAAAVEMLTLARLIGLPWSKTLLRTAAQCGRADIVDWLLLYGCPFDAEALITQGATQLFHPSVQAALKSKLIAEVKNYNDFESIWRYAGAPGPNCAEKVKPLLSCSTTMHINSAALAHCARQTSAVCVLRYCATISTEVLVVVSTQRRTAKCSDN
jgi:hypothetical protein